MLALQHLREADVVRVDGESLGRFIYVVRDADAIIDARSRELDAMVARNLRSLSDAGFDFTEIREAYQRSLANPSACDKRGDISAAVAEPSSCLTSSHHPRMTSG